MQPTLMPQLKIDSHRLQADFEEISRIGQRPDRSICRPALSREDLEARAWFADRVEEAGFFVVDDDAGNLSGLLRCADPFARTLLIGSHLDTVANAGRYDGALGMVAGLECLRVIKEAGLKLPVHLELIDFTDDEGAWQPMFGSMSLTGRLGPDFVKSGDGQMSAFRAALTRAGINPEHIHRAQRDPRKLAGYIELHIEQGGRLEKAGVNIGVVSSIVGRKAYRMIFHGQAGYAGTASMSERRDALQGACLFVTRAHDLARTQFPEGVLNCGRLELKPGTLTTIPSMADLTVEVRHVNEALLQNMESALFALAEECAAATRVTAEQRCTGHIPAAVMNGQVIDAIERACENVGSSHMRLPSYASHNAQVMSSFTPSGMLFIPSVNGTSHNPDEYSHWDDVVRGTNVLLHTVVNLAYSY